MTISNVGEDMEQMEHSYMFLLFRSFMPGRAGGEVRRGSRDRYIYISIISQNLISQQVTVLQMLAEDTRLSGSKTKYFIAHCTTSNMGHVYIGFPYPTWGSHRCLCLGWLAFQKKNPELKEPSILQQIVSKPVFHPRG